MKDRSIIKGIVHVQLWTPSALHSDKLILKDEEIIENLVTEYGDQFYGEKAAGIGSHAAPTGMRVGSGGGTAAAKTGAGAAIVTYTTSNTQFSAFDATYPQSALNGSSRRITYRASWAAGEATNASITEAVITNESPLTDVAGTTANTISRVTFTAKNKTSIDTLIITWYHDMLGA